MTNFIAVSAGRLIEDRTGLAGNYEFTLIYKPSAGRPPDPNAPLDERPDVFTALQEQLGLKLEPSRGLVNMLVIDAVERPTPN